MQSVGDLIMAANKNELLKNIYANADKSETNTKKELVKLENVSLLEAINNKMENMKEEMGLKKEPKEKKSTEVQTFATSKGEQGSFTVKKTKKEEEDEEEKKKKLEEFMKKIGEFLDKALKYKTVDEDKIAEMEKKEGLSASHQNKGAPQLKPSSIKG